MNKELWPIRETVDEHGDTVRYNNAIAVTYKYSYGKLHYKVRPLWYDPDGSSLIYAYKAIAITGTVECTRGRASNLVDIILSKAYTNDSYIGITGWIRLATSDCEYYDVQGNRQSFSMQDDEWEVINRYKG